jgi:transcriptional/translational regulatory protein YebC/TACO1
VEATHSDPKRDAESDAIEAGAQELEPLEPEEIPAGHAGTRFLTGVKDLDAVSKALKAFGWTILASEIRYIAKTFPELEPVARKEVTDFLTALDDHEDVHRVYAALRAS